MSEDGALHIVKLNPEPEEYVEAETAFLRAIGLCITQWAFIDRMLFRLFKQGIGAPTHRAAIVFYDQHSINSHFRQVDALFRGLLEDKEYNDLRELWKELREKITDLLPTRNVIAHQPVRRIGTHDGQKAVYIYGIYVEPYQRFLKKDPKGMKGKAALVTEDLNAHAEAVEELMVQLISFSKMVIRTFTR
ncbi:MAG: hypothetical protein E6447_22290 [Bradyrhizobium sp.]|nr:hypothetical protein [Bradyrhizobium sp.]